MRLHDYLIAALLLILALAIAVHASTFPGMPGQPVGPGFFPTLIAAGIALGALVVLAGAGLGVRTWVLPALSASPAASASASRRP